MAILASVIFWLSFLFSVFILFYALIIRSWKSFLSLGIVSLPLSLYILAGEPPVQFFGLLSLISLAIALLLFLLKKRKPVY